MTTPQYIKAGLLMKIGHASSSVYWVFGQSMESSQAAQLCPDICCFPAFSFGGVATCTIQRPCLSTLEAGKIAVIEAIIQPITCVAEQCVCSWYHIARIMGVFVMVIPRSSAMAFMSIQQV